MSVQTAASAGNRQGGHGGFRLSSPRHAAPGERLLPRPLYWGGGLVLADSSLEEAIPKLERFVPSALRWSVIPTAVSGGQGGHVPYPGKLSVKKEVLVRFTQEFVCEAVTSDRRRTGEPPESPLSRWLPGSPSPAEAASETLGASLSFPPC